MSEAIAKTDAEQTIDKVVAATLTANDKPAPAMQVKLLLASKFHRLRASIKS